MADDEPVRLLNHLRSRRDEMVALLRSLAEIESPSRDPASQDEILELLARRVRELGFRTRRVRGKVCGGHLLARPEDRRGPYQLILGHCDTVWPTGTLASMPVSVDGDTMRGPGVFDMKAGLVQMLFALSSLRQLGLEPTVAPVILVTSDEEIGSPDSERWVRRLARVVCRALVLEPALGADGRLKTRRKGTGTFEVRIVGRGSHAGLAPRDGASAVQELSHVIQRLHGLTDHDRGVTVNVGEVSGGSRPNIVAPSARALVDVRVPDAEEARRVETAIHGLEPDTPGTRLAIEGGVSRPPMEPTPRNRALWRAARREAAALGLDLDEGTAGGASDGNFTSLETATLDGLGGVGGGAHADDEHVRIDALPERSALLARLLMLPPDATIPEA